MEKREFQNFFVWNGSKYYTGTVIIVKDMGRQVEASFVCYDKTYNRYISKIKECMHHVYPKQFEQALIEVTDRIDKKVHLPDVKTLKDLDSELNRIAASGTPITLRKQNAESIRTNVRKQD